MNASSCSTGMPLLFVLEDDRDYLRKASDVARAAGFTNFEVNAFPSNAKLYLERALDGRVPLPDAFLIDLNLGMESGFELLRFWHRDARLKKIPAIVWTASGAHEREMCDLFGVHRFVSKDEHLHVLREALESVVPSAGNTPAE